MSMKVSDNKKIVFITGTRADYGKMKPLMKGLEKHSGFDVYVFVCGMHILKKYGSTYDEVLKDGYKNIHVAYGLSHSSDAGMNMGNTISYLSGYVENIDPDMIIVHGDRMDALAGAVIGALKNILVAHIEGGELSGTVDESIRHAISKFAHIHFVSTEGAKKRLVQLGEEENRIFVIGSPDIDIMLGKDLPSLREAKKRYDISYDQYGILIYHPVTTEITSLKEQIRSVVDAVIESGNNYVVIYPNNDLGSDYIVYEYERIKDNLHFKVFPSIRFEYFLTLLKNADFIIGNSSSGIREAGIYGVPAIDIGTRQNGRYEKNTDGITHVTEETSVIRNAINEVDRNTKEEFRFGDGKSTELFLSVINDPAFWDIKIQKEFVDREV